MRPLMLVFAALLPGCVEELACGPGTMKVGGYCVPAGDTDAEPSSGGSNVTRASNSDDDDGESAETEDSIGGTTFVDEPPYAACFAGSDAECSSNENCNASLNTCASHCLDDTACPNPPDGTAVQRCEFVDAVHDDICLLYCGVEGSTCPTGMACVAVELCPSEAGDSSGYGYGGGSTGCDFATLEVCVWM